MATTGDGGRSWRPVVLPDAKSVTLYGVTPLGPRVAALRARDMLHRMRLLVTADGGATWRWARDRPAVDGAPAGWLPIGPIGGGTDELLAVDPVAGTVASVRGTPNLREAVFVPGTGDSWWLRGRTADGRAAVAVSNDRGRTWATQAFPVAGMVLLAARDDRTAYAAIGAAFGKPSNAPAVWVTRDGGATWQELGATLPKGHLTGVAVLSDGALVIRTTARAVCSTHRSIDGGDTFSAVDGMPGTSLQVLSDGTQFASDVSEHVATLVTSSIKPNRTYLSADGFTWMLVPYPPL